ncbi:hypothetical protein EJ08DRAFT_599240 [Tothia fuscella]|uniref:Mediator of RNA polymerase II transcription subunit 18 n=1 Tax=Tothia fuscella TaxID=1048955 RepID=A0A9P4TS26_9PEZI|nr:hypothetical protein EJ08DRAFT_599240 [Tothia fuscella]
MHELLLYGQLPAARHDQLLNIISGVAAMQPDYTLERHVIFKPTRPLVQSNLLRGGVVKSDAQVVKTKKSAQSTAGTERADMYHVRLIKRVEEDDFGGDVDMDSVEKGKGQGGGSKGWRLRFEDVPEPGKRAALLRMVDEQPFLGGEISGYMEGLGYKPVTEYIVEGHRAVHGNIVLFLHRILTRPGAKSISINAPLASFSDYIPMDPANGYLLSTTVRLSDGGIPKLVDMGMDELEAFRRMMLGVIDLDQPDRLALDTRVK